MCLFFILNTLMNKQDIPLLDIPIDYIMGDDVTGTLLNDYGRFPCQIKAAIFAYCAHGTAKATINITEYQVHEGDYIMMVPNSFIYIHEVSDDALFYFLGFSSTFIQRTNYMKSLIGRYNLVRENPIFPLPPDISKVFSEAIQMLVHAGQLRESLLTPDLMSNIVSILIQITVPLYDKISKNQQAPRTREEAIGKEFAKLVMENYSKEHHLTFYAEKIGITVPHLCVMVKKRLGMTAMQVISQAIMTDAKAQLKSSDAQIKEIAISLGFSNMSFFNKFFKEHTQMTPKQYREQG